MRKPDWWNWPPFMTVTRHNREITALAENFQQAVDREYARASLDGNVKVHAFMVEANYNVFNHPRPDVAIRAVFQQAERMFAPDHTDIKEAVDAAEAAAR